MKHTDPRYARFHLVREMLQTPEVIRRFDPGAVEPFADAVRRAGRSGRLFLTGEGSSRIFPAKRALYDGLRHAGPLCLATDGATQALEYDLSGWVVFAASNSGRTKEVVRLMQALKSGGHRAVFGLTATAGSPVAELSARSHILGSGKEEAVAATKTVVEQALFYDCLLATLRGKPVRARQELEPLADMVEQALTQPVPAELTEKALAATAIYFAGRNDGVAEELTLKANEITRKKADYLEGTYAVHGIEEVMDSAEAVVVVEPFAQEADKFRECLVDGVGLSVLAIGTRPSGFPTMLIPDAGERQSYVQIAAGWNLLVEIGVGLGIDLDRPQRARKVGNLHPGG